MTERVRNCQPYATQLLGKEPPYQRGLACGFRAASRREGVRGLKELQLCPHASIPSQTETACVGTRLRALGKQYQKTIIPQHRIAAQERVRPLATTQVPKVLIRRPGRRIWRREQTPKHSEAQARAGRYVKGHKTKTRKQANKYTVRSRGTAERELRSGGHTQTATGPKKKEHLGKESCSVGEETHRRGVPCRRTKRSHNKRRPAGRRRGGEINRGWGKAAPSAKKNELKLEYASWRPRPLSCGNWYRKSEIKPKERRGMREREESPRDL